VIVRPLVTEKSMRGVERHNTYCFEVDRRATRIDVRKAVEAVFRVHVTGVRTMNIRGKARGRFGAYRGKSPDWKKAMVTLRAGDRIEVI
jgi:large subunit ribosomal protein L23